MSEINLHNIDCMKFIKTIPDHHYELAIVDPPYYDDAKNIIIPDGKVSTTGVDRKKYHMGRWNAPSHNYFIELKRVSRHQIIWGINYFAINNPGSGRIDKKTDNGEMRFSHCEIAYSSMHNNVVIFRYLWNGMLQGDMKNKEIRIHPTQKPVALYAWLLEKYAKPGDKILDTHLGSGSIAIACHNLGFSLDACEIDEHYYTAAKERFEKHQQQLTLF